MNVEDALVVRILASEGGRKLLGLSDAEMSRFLTAAESTFTTFGPEDAAVKETLEAAREALAPSATNCDLVLQGTSNLRRGVALTGALSVIVESGYRLQWMAGAGSGALVAALLGRGGHTVEQLVRLWQTTDFKRFERSPVVSRALHRRSSLAEDTEFREWLGSLLMHATFAPYKSGDGRTSKLEILLQIDNGEVIALPRDAARLGIDPSAFLVEDAIRLSIIDPQTDKPLIFNHRQTNVPFSLRGPDADFFPIQLFDRDPPQWPTFGIRMVEKESSPAALTPRDAARTIDIDLEAVEENQSGSIQELGALYKAGRDAARRFLTDWRFDDYIASLPSSHSSE